MASLSRTPHSVNLDLSEASAASLEALRGVMRGDEPYWDETPVLDDEHYPPSEADSRWWAIETEPPGEWLDVDLEPLPLEYPVTDMTGFFGHAREEP